MVPDLDYQSGSSQHSPERNWLSLPHHDGTKLRLKVPWLTCPRTLVALGSAAPIINGRNPQICLLATQVPLRNSGLRCLALHSLCQCTCTRILADDLSTHSFRHRQCTTSRRPFCILVEPHAPSTSPRSLSFVSPSISVLSSRRSRPPALLRDLRLPPTSSTSLPAFCSRSLIRVPVQTPVLHSQRSFKLFETTLQSLKQWFQIAFLHHCPIRSRYFGWSI